MPATAACTISGRALTMPWISCWIMLMPAVMICGKACAIPVSKLTMMVMPALMMLGSI